MCKVDISLTPECETNKTCALGGMQVVRLCSPRRFVFVRPAHCSVEAVGHELALAVGGDERDGAVVLKA